jgi:hypothetical protein
MSADKTINGENTDTYVKDRLVSIAQSLSPVQSTDGWLAYASLLLAWILEGETEKIRFTRTTAIQKAHSGRLLLPSWERQMIYPEFLTEAEKIAEFLS